MTIWQLTPEDLHRFGLESLRLGNSMPGADPASPQPDAGDASAPVRKGLESLYQAAALEGSYLISNGNKLIQVAEDALLVDGRVKDDLTCQESQSWA